MSEAGNMESRMAGLEARVARLEATAAAGPATTHVHYHVGYAPMPAGAPSMVGFPPCCGFGSCSVEPDDQAAPTPADFSKLGE